MRSVVVVSILAVLLALNIKTLQAETKNDWWESASLYQIYPRSFKDSNKDGVGDIKGITSRLEYLKEIGVTATWLSPIFDSPMKDFGYDISNFTHIEPIFGTLEDFDGLIAKAKKLGVKILLDFVPNHSSDQCEWFKKSIKRVKGFEDFYVWEDGKVQKNSNKRLPPSNWVSVFGGSQWTWHPERQQFYLHQFLPEQPDLNFKNPLVRQHMLGVLKYWLDRGVDGFRIDAVPHLFEKRFDNGSYPDEPKSGWSDNPNDYSYLDHIYTKDQPETVELMYEWREFLNQYKKENGGDTRILLGESYSSIEFLSALYGNRTHHGAQLPMNFNLMYLNGLSTAEDVQNAVDGWMKVMWKKHKTANWVIGNHDNDRVAQRLGQHKVDLLNVIAHCLPGATVTYYGEEIGMSNVGNARCATNPCENRNLVRTPMQWNTKQYAGFTEGNVSWLPVAENFKTFNVQIERQVSLSSLNIYKALQKLKKTPAFKNFKAKNGFSYKAITKQVFQITRSLPGQEEYIILVNMGNKMEYIENLSEKTYEFEVVTSHSLRRKGEKINLKRRIHLLPYEAFVLRWEK